MYYSNVDFNRNFYFMLFQDRKQLEILECLQFGRRFKKYSSNVRLFCFTLHFYSPKAYEYVRSTFNLNLPSIRAIRYWYSTIDGSPGFTENAFNALQQKVDNLKSEGKSMHVGLIYDEMAIRKHSQWDKAKKEFIGHINAGRPGEHGVCSPLCKEVLVLMVSGLTEEFKMPIAYFLSNGLCAGEKAAILKEAMLKLNNIGVIVASITNDGPHTNISTSKLLGADYAADRPYFKNPFNRSKVVYMVLDPPHSLKLARNCIGNKKVLYDSKNNKIEWKFIEDLVSLQISKNVALGNKLSKTHIEWENRKMNVRIAAETLSNSVATSIEYLDTVAQDENFRNSEGTVQYLREINNLFDIMNSKRKHCDQHYKQPISETNIDKINSYFEHAKEYIKGLQLVENGKKMSVFKTRSFTPFFGFYYNIISFIGIYNDYIKPNEPKEFYTFSISQDHLESFFGCIRRMGGNINI